jgi:hypothetical protein
VATSSGATTSGGGGGATTSVGGVDDPTTRVVLDLASIRTAMIILVCRVLR